MFFFIVFALISTTCAQENTEDNVGPVDIGEVVSGDVSVFTSLLNAVNAETLSTVGYQTLYAVLASILFNTLISYALPFVVSGISTGRGFAGSSYMDNLQQATETIENLDNFVSKYELGHVPYVGRMFQMLNTMRRYVTATKEEMKEAKPELVHHTRSILEGLRKGNQMYGLATKHYHKILQSVAVDDADMTTVHPTV